MKYRFKIKKVYNKDGQKSPFWTILIYRNGMLFDESIVQYSSFWTVLKLWLAATLRII